MSRALHPLRLPALRRLLAGYAVSGFGDWFGEIALSVLVFRETHSVVAVSALWIVGRIVPALAGPPLVVRLAGLRVPVLYAAEAAVFAVLALAAAGGAPLGVLLALTLLDGTLALAARALTKAAIVAAADPAGVLAEANQLLNVVFAASMTAGPALAGVAVAGLGPAAALALDGASFAAAGLLLVRGRAGVERTHEPRVSLAEAARRVRDASTISLLLAIEGTVAVCFALILPVELVFVTDALGGSAADFGLVLAAWGAGAVLGSGVLTRLGDRDPAAVLVMAFALMVSGYLGMGAAGGVAMVTACSLIGGIGQGLEGCAILTAVQRRTPRELQAHVNALTEAVRTAAPGVGFALGGAMAAVGSPRTTYIVAGLAALAVVTASASALSAAMADTAAPAPAV
jgi:hypothetical protein